MKNIIGSIVIAILGGCASALPSVPVEPIPDLPRTGNCPTLPEPVKRVDPRYPARAMQTSQAGWVLIDFDVSADGSTSNLRVVAASPRGVFEAAGMDSLRQMKFQPNNPLQGCRFEVRFNY
jgi:TonB family protein